MNPTTDIPIYLSIFFGFAVLFTAVAWIWAAKEKGKTAAFIAAWLLLHSYLGFTGVYETLTTPVPIFIALLVAFSIVFIIGFSGWAAPFRNSLNPEIMTYIHTIRVEVELILYGLYSAGWASVYQTFAGSNLDILAGLTAPIIAYLFFRERALSSRMLWWWNVGCLFLLTNVLLTSLVSVPHEFQQLAFDQPFLAVLQFPFNLLPLFVVPSMFAAHFVVMKRLK